MKKLSPILLTIIFIFLLLGHLLKEYGSFGNFIKITFVGFVLELLGTIIIFFAIWGIILMIGRIAKAIKLKEQFQKFKKLIVGDYELRIYDNNFIKVDKRDISYSKNICDHSILLSKFCSECKEKVDKEVLKAIDVLNVIRQDEKAEEFLLIEQNSGYYDSQDDACYSGKEGIEYWKTKTCPKTL